MTTPMTGALRSEWAKLRSSRSLVWTLVAMIVCTIALTAFLTAVGHTDATRAGEGDDDVVVNALFGVQVAQIAVVSFGVLMIASEYATGMMRTTLSATPRRGILFAAKALLVGAAAGTAGVIASVASFLIAQPLLHGGGYVPPAYPVVTLGDADVLRAVLGTGLFLMLLALFAFGLGGVLRHTSAAVTLAVGAVLLPTVLGGFLTGRIRDLILQSSPVAGLAIQATRERLVGPPIAPWAGIGVTFGWAFVAVLAAYFAFRVRDV
jgi:ABC-type transport system involved in multi-copper enzyme maturation permease subunit